MGAYSTRVSKGAGPAFMPIGAIRNPAASPVRIKLDGFTIGNIDAVVVDAGFEIQLQRTSAVPTVATFASKTPQADDPPLVAATALVDDTFTAVHPGVVANAFHFAEGLNKRNSIIWYAPASRPIWIPATVSNGLVLNAVSGGAGNAADWAGTLYHSE